MNSKGFIRTNLFYLTIVYSIFTFLTIWTWRKWPDILIDFGRELYIAWQMSIGKSLYVDIYYEYGPLAPVINGTLFYLFGDSFTTLIVFNLLLTATATFLIYLYFFKASDQLNALIVSLAFLLYFAFPHFTGVGNYNWITPYSYSYTYGIFFCFTMLVTLQRNINRFSYQNAAIAGLSFGLLLLTRAELIIASFSAFISYMFYIFLFDKTKSIHKLKFMIIFLKTLLGPLLFLHLFSSMTIFDIASALSLPFKSVIDNQIFDNTFYNTSTGFNQPFKNLLIMALETLGVFFFLWHLVMINYSAETKNILAKLKYLVPSLIFLVFSIFLKSEKFPFVIVNKSLLFIPIATGVLCFLLLLKEKNESIKLKYISLFIWSIFSIVLLGKILLSPRIYHYGFVFACGAMLISITSFSWLFPNIIIKNKTTRYYRIFLTCFLCVELLYSFYLSNNIYRYKVIPVGNHGDKIKSFPFNANIIRSGKDVAELIETINNIVPPCSTLTVIPEGIMINYLLRIQNPSKFIVFMPTILNRVGEMNIKKSFIEAHPDYIVLIPKDPSEFGLGYFGKDANNGKLIMDWIKANYSEIWVQSDDSQLHPDQKIRLYKSDS